MQNNISTKGIAEIIADVSNALVGQFDMHGLSIKL